MDYLAEILIILQNKEIDEATLKYIYELLLIM